MLTGPELGAALRAAQEADPSSVPELLRRIARTLPASDIVVYQADFSRNTLEPLPDRGPHVEVPESETVSSSMAGRAFTEQRAVVAERPAGNRVWVPIMESSDCTGVLALTVSEATDLVLASCEEVGLLAGYLILAEARSTDFYNLYRRRQALSVAATMQWDLLPPLVLRTTRLSVAGLLEPAYDVGGDCFDYALNDFIFNVAIFDALGHGVGSALIAALAVGSYRHDRREGRVLERIHANLDEAIHAHLPQLSFVTGQLAQLDVETGAMTWTNAGHPLPMLIRNGQVIQLLECPPTPPWGLGRQLSGHANPMAVAREALEPGDSVLFYTDGVTEAHSPDGELFGTDRLADLAGQHASNQVEPEEIVRLLTRAVVDHRRADLDDDVTMVLVRWNGPTRGGSPSAP